MRFNKTSIIDHPSISHEGRINYHNCYKSKNIIADTISYTEYYRTPRESREKVNYRSYYKSKIG